MPAPTRAGDRCARHRIGDGEVVAADPTAAGLGIKQPSVVCDAEPASQGRDPPVVGSHLDRSKGWANNSRTRTVGGCNPIDVRFNAKDEIAELIVESELASCDECALVVYIVEAQAEESVGQITLAPGSAEVGADVESSPTEGGATGRASGGTSAAFAAINVASNTDNAAVA